MKQVTMALLVVCLLFVVSQALAMEQPTVTTPQDGAVLGPNYDILGSMPYKAFLVLVTDVIRTDTGEVLRTVPGLRHWTNADGTFHFRAASPRVSIGEKNTNVSYRIRIFESGQGGNGPETVINATMPQ